NSAPRKFACQPEPIAARVLFFGRPQSSPVTGEFMSAAAGLQLGAAPLRPRSADMGSAGGSGLVLFDTPVGRCALAWPERGIAALQLPERDDATTLARAARRAPGATACEPPPAMAA